MTRESLEEEYLRLLEEEVAWRKVNKLELYKPYKKQKEFHDALADVTNIYIEKCLFAGNQSGKTFSAANEVAMHLTGRYPKWWKGKRFDHPVKFWAAGITGESTRDGPQKLLIGEPGERDEWGTGTIPKDCLGRCTMARGTADLVDHISIKHVSGKWSHLYFKFYGKGREKWQSVTIDGIWFDEEPPSAVYDEGLIRIKAKKGIAMTTFTPLLGMSEVVSAFWEMDKTDPKNRNKAMIQMSIEDVAKEKHGHVSQDEVDDWILTLKPYERDARARGVPLLGSGKVFPIEEDKYITAPFEVPRYYRRICGLDFGWGDHPTAAVWLAIDPETKTGFVYSEYKSHETGLGYHASAIRKKGNIPAAWPHDGLQHDKSSGIQIRYLYKNHGVKMIDQHAQYPDDRKNGLEASIADILDRFKDGTLKIFSNCVYLLDELRFFHRKEGKIVTTKDDLISAMRYAIMMERYAKAYEKPKEQRERYAGKPAKRSWMCN